MPGQVKKWTVWKPRRPPFKKRRWGNPHFSGVLALRVGQPPRASFLWDASPWYSVLDGDPLCLSQFRVLAAQCTWLVFHHAVSPEHELLFLWHPDEERGDDQHEPQRPEWQAVWAFQEQPQGPQQVTGSGPMPEEAKEPAPSPWETPKMSVGQFLDAVESLREYWRPRDDEELWFRGERKHRDTRLCPQLYRQPEKRSLKPIPELLDIEFDLYEDFQRCGAQLCDTKPEDDWDWYFLMQHHGAPTRILDWSDGALNGLHFALRNTELVPEENAVVYVLQPYLLLDHIKALPDYVETQERWKTFLRDDPSESYANSEWDFAYLPNDEWKDKVPLPRAPLLWDTAHFTRRFGAQRSRFMLFGTDPLWMQNVADTHDWVKTIQIESGSIPKIRRELRDAGVTESVIFPDLDGLGREMRQVWDERR